VDEEKLRAEIAEDFAGVADVFRAKGESDSTSISFINMTEDTVANPDGYEVDVTRSATRGNYLSLPIVAPIVVNETNNTFVIRVDGAQSEEIVVEPGTYTVDEYARQLQNGITNDEVIGTRRVRVIPEGDRIRVNSGRYGSRSSIAFEGLGGVPTTATGLAGGESEDGANVEGSIGGEAAEGIGQLLRGADDSKKVKGLRLIVNLPQSQLIPNSSEASIKITKGVGSRLAKHIKDVLDPRVGNMQRITSSLRSAIDNIDDQLEQINQRIERKRTRLQTKFAKLEGQLSTLRSQQNSLAGGGGLPKIGSGSPGLPGL
jgi:flagellar capping protein FliD